MGSTVHKKTPVEKGGGISIGWSRVWGGIVISVPESDWGGTESICQKRGEGYLLGRSRKIGHVREALRTFSNSKRQFLVNWTKQECWPKKRKIPGTKNKKKNEKREGVMGFLGASERWGVFH